MYAQIVCSVMVSNRFASRCLNNKHTESSASKEKQIYNHYSMHTFHVLPLKTHVKKSNKTMYMILLNFIHNYVINYSILPDLYSQNAMIYVPCACCPARFTAALTISSTSILTSLSSTGEKGTGTKGAPSLTIGAFKL